jgi:hypothetical protein
VSNALDLLRLLTEARPCVTQRALSKQLDWPYRRVQRAMEALRRRKYVERLHPDCYRATAAGRAAWREGVRITVGPKGPLTGRRVTAQGKLRPRLWRAIRILKKFTVGDLISIAASEAEHCEPAKLNASALRYLSCLRRAGYIVVLREREPGSAPTSNGFKRYLLLPDRNTGPLAPQIGKGGTVYDPNLRETRQIAGVRP